MNDISKTDVYINKMYELENEYINTQINDINDIYTNIHLFSGMIAYIYQYVFKPPKDMKTKHNSRSILNTNDIELLDEIFIEYTRMCYRYNKKPTLMNFSILTGIHTKAFREWKDGIARNSKPIYREVVQNWYNICESALYDGAIERNSIGCIFGLKARYGWSEAPQRIEVTQGQTPEVIAADIANRRLTQDSTELPELPSLD